MSIYPDNIKFDQTSDQFSTQSKFKPHISSPNITIKNDSPGLVILNNLEIPTSIVHVQTSPFGETGFKETLADLGSKDSKMTKRASLTDDDLAHPINDLKYQIQVTDSGEEEAGFYDDDYRKLMKEPGFYDDEGDSDKKSDKYNSRTYIMSSSHNTYYSDISPLEYEQFATSALQMDRKTFIKEICNFVINLFSICFENSTPTIILMMNSFWIRKCQST